MITNTHTHTRSSPVAIRLFLKTGELKRNNRLKIIKPFCPTRLFKTTSIIVSLTPDPTMLWAISSYHMHSHTHTHTRLVVCFSFVTYLHHCCVTTVPPLLCCLIVSIHPRQSNLKKKPTRYPLPLLLLLRPPPNLHPPPPPVYLLSRCLFVPLSVVSLFPCVTGFEFFCRRRRCC